MPGAGGLEGWGAGFVDASHIYYFKAAVTFTKGLALARTGSLVGGLIEVTVYDKDTHSMTDFEGFCMTPLNALDVMREGTIRHFGVLRAKRGATKPANGAWLKGEDDGKVVVIPSPEATTISCGYVIDNSESAADGDNIIIFAMRTTIYHAQS